MPSTRVSARVQLDQSKGALVMCGYDEIASMTTARFNAAALNREPGPQRGFTVLCRDNKTGGIVTLNSPQETLCDVIDAMYQLLRHEKDFVVCRGEGEFFREFGAPDSTLSRIGRTIADPSLFQLAA